MNRSMTTDDGGDEGGRDERERRMMTMRVRRGDSLPPSVLPHDEGECDEDEDEGDEGARVDVMGRHRWMGRCRPRSTPSHRPCEARPSHGKDRTRKGDKRTSKGTTQSTNNYNPNNKRERERERSRSTTTSRDTTDRLKCAAE
jgi:hypothetical protein